VVGLSVPCFCFFSVSSPTARESFPTCSGD
jgi:hypothetical protein